MLLAGLDGIQKGIDPGAPADFDLFEEAGADIPQVPGSLAESLDALEADHEFLLAGGVFTESLIETWIDWKRENEVDPFASGRTRPSSSCTSTPEASTGNAPRGSQGRLRDRVRRLRLQGERVPVRARRRERKWRQTRQ